MFVVLLFRPKGFALDKQRSSALRASCPGGGTGGGRAGLKRVIRLARDQAGESRDEVDEVGWGSLQYYDLYQMEIEHSRVQQRL